MKEREKTQQKVLLEKSGGKWLDEGIGTTVKAPEGKWLALYWWKKVTTLKT